jgi:hypothetical protein
MGANSDFWLFLHSLAQAIRDEGPPGEIRQASLADSFEALAPLARRELAHDYRLVVAELNQFEPILLSLSLEDEPAARAESR